MKEIIFHGRGGQGSVTATRILVVAADYEGKYAQSFPFFGFERRGAPVSSAVRLDEKPLVTRSLVYYPDCIAVLDPKLLGVLDLTKLKPGGILVLNTAKGLREVDIEANLSKLAVVDATNISTQIFGSATIPITNTAMLGAFAKATEWVGLESIIRAIGNTFKGPMVERNVESAKIAFENTLVEEMETISREIRGKEESRIIRVELDLAPITREIGGVKTGLWATLKPVFDKELCTKCSICAKYCPEGVILVDEEGYYIADYDYCKGCGICSVECPFEAVKMVMESEVEIVH